MLFRENTMKLFTTPLNEFSREAIRRQKAKTHLSLLDNEFELNPVIKRLREQICFFKLRVLDARDLKIARDNEIKLRKT
jgi:hypothetical protein